MHSSSKIWIFLLFSLALTPNVIAQTVRVIDNKGTLKELTAGQGIGFTNAGATIKVSSLYDGVTLLLNGSNQIYAANTTAYWNANKLQGFDISTTAPSNGQVLGYNGTNWSPVSPSTYAWLLLGNSGTDPGTASGKHFIGTTDNKDLVFATQGSEKMRLFSLNSIPALGIGESDLSGVNGGASTWSGPTLFLGTEGNIASKTGLDIIIDADKNASNSSFRIRANGDGATGTVDLVAVEETGNVGIGKINPAYKLDVAGDVNFTGALRTNGSAGTSGQVLTSTGTGASWQLPSSLFVTSFKTTLSGLTPTTASTGAVSLDGTLGVANGGTGLSSIGTANQVLAVNSGGTALNWITPNSGTVTSIATNSGLTGGPIISSGTIGIATNGVNNSLFRQSIANTLVGNPTNSTANVTDIAIGTGLAFSGSTLTISNIPNTSLANSTISGVSLGSNLNALTAGTGITLNGTTGYNGISAQTVNIDATKIPYLSSGFSTGFLKYNGTAWQFDNNTYLTSAYYQRVQTNGTGLTQRSTLNFGSEFTLADNTTNTRTDVSINNIGWSKITGAPSFITLGSLSANSPLSYDNTTGKFSISQATTSTDGYLSKADWNTFNSKEPAITVGTTAQYWRGDKTWQTLNTSAVPEGTNLYYTDNRARSAISLTTTGTSGAATYNSTTGVVNIPNYTYTLPVATSLALGGVKIGSGINVAADGTISNSGILSITGTANQVFVNGTSGTATTGAVILTLPQNIGTSNSPTFAGLTLSSASLVNKLLCTNGSGVISPVTIGSGLSFDTSTGTLSASGGSSTGWLLGGNNLTSITQSVLGSLDSNNFPLTIMVSGTKAGYLGTTSDNNTSLGISSTNGSANSSQRATAIGASAQATNNDATALGYNAQATNSQYTTALGSTAKATSNNATAVGYGAQAITSDNTTAIGSTAKATSNNATAVGYGAQAIDNQYVTALGSTAQANKNNATAVGYHATAAYQATALGSEASASGDNSTAVGYNTKAPNPNTVILGSNANVGIGTLNPRTPTSTSNPNTPTSGSTTTLAVNGIIDAPIYTSIVQALTGGTIAWDLSLGSSAKVTLQSGSNTLQLSNMKAGMYGVIVVTTAANTTSTLTFTGGTNKVINGGKGVPYLTPSTTTEASNDILSFFYDGSTFWWTIGNNYN